MVEAEEKKVYIKGKWILIWVILSIVSYFIIQNGSSNTTNSEDVNEITITQRNDIGNTESIKKLQDKLYAKHGVKLNIVVVNNLVTSDYYSEALSVFKTYYNCDANSMLMYIAINDRKIALHTGSNIRNTYTSEVCNNCVKLCQDYFRQNKYNEGIEVMIKDLNNKEQSASVIKGKSKDCGNGYTIFLSIIMGGFFSLFIVIRMSGKNKGSVDGDGCSGCGGGGGCSGCGGGGGW